MQEQILIQIKQFQDVFVAEIDILDKEYNL